MKVTTIEYSSDFIKGMSSNFPLNELTNCQAIPSKMKKKADRPKTGQSIPFNKLCALISDKIHARASQKEGKTYKIQQPLPKTSKGKRVVSHQYPSISRSANKSPPNENYFNQFFEYFQASTKRQDFRPYREQQRFRCKFLIRSQGNRQKRQGEERKADTKVERYQDRQKESEIDRWHITLQSPNTSLLHPNSPNDA